jgi:hypothetical protein
MKRHLALLIFAAAMLSGAFAIEADKAPVPLFEVKKGSKLLLNRTELEPATLHQRLPELLAEKPVFYTDGRNRSFAEFPNTGIIVPPYYETGFHVALLVNAKGMDDKTPLRFTGKLAIGKAVIDFASKPSYSAVQTLLTKEGMTLKHGDFSPETDREIVVENVRVTFELSNDDVIHHVDLWWDVGFSK